MDNFYKNQDFRYVEIAEASEDFFTTASSAKFYIPTLQPFTSNTTELRPYPAQSNIVNKENNLGIAKTNTFTGHIDIPIFPELIGSWYQNRVPKGTKFMIVFVGGDIMKPRIIGRY